jgi:hypothetical protein
VIHIQTIEQVDFETAASQKACEIKETKRLRPKIIGCKIVDPGIY